MSWLVRCPICGVSRTRLSKHLRVDHNIDRQAFNERFPNSAISTESVNFDPDRFDNVIYDDPSKYIKCPICAEPKMSLFNHIIQGHNMTWDEFVAEYGDHPKYSEVVSENRHKGQLVGSKKYSLTLARKREEQAKSREEFCRLRPDEFVKCQICGTYVKNLANHVRLKHSMEWGHYRLSYPGSQAMSNDLLETFAEEMKTNWLNPDLASKYSSYWKSEEHAKKCSSRMSSYWGDPVIRERLARNGYGKGSRIYSKLVGKFVYVRSTLEARFASYCEEHNIKYDYEPKAFNFVHEGKSRVYIPDFYLEDYDVYIEIKPEGFQSDEDVLRKCQVVLDAGENLIMIGKTVLNNLDEFFSNLRDSHSKEPVTI